MKQPNVQERLEHILQAIENIGEFTRGGFDALDVKTTSAVYYQLLIIGEAARHIPKELQVHFNDIPWIKMMGLRNIIAHEYFALKHERIVAALCHLPLLIERLQTLINELPDAYR